MNARSSDVGCDTPQKWQRMAPGCTVAAQCLQVSRTDAYAGFNHLYAADRRPAPIIEAACWAHARRKFFELARINKAPIAAEAVTRIDALFDIEREINGLTPPQRIGVRIERSRPLVIDLESWLREQRAEVSNNSDTGKAIDYSLKRWTALTRFLDPIMRPSVSCVLLRSDARIGPLPVLMKAPSSGRSVYKPVIRQGQCGQAGFRAPSPWQATDCGVLWPSSRRRCLRPWPRTRPACRGCRYRCGPA